MKVEKFATLKMYLLNILLTVLIALHGSPCLGHNEGISKFVKKGKAKFSKTAFLLKNILFINDTIFERTVNLLT